MLTVGDAIAILGIGHCWWPLKCMDCALSVCTPINNYHAIPVCSAPQLSCNTSDNRCNVLAPLHSILCTQLYPHKILRVFALCWCWWLIFRFGQISGSLCTLCSCMRWLSQRLLIEGNFCKISRLFEKWNKSFQRLINRTFGKWGPTWVTTWKAPNDIQN